MTCIRKEWYTMASRTGILLMMTICSIFFYPLRAQSVTSGVSDTLSVDRIKMMNGEPVVMLTRLDEGVTDVTGIIFIAAPPKKVWDVLTDYNHQKNFIPNIIESGLITDDGVEQVVSQTGKSKILIFQMKVSVTLKIRGDYLRSLDFQQISGDFKVYKGRWILEESPQGHGTLLYYKAEVKPNFFAPAFIVRSVQKHDFPAVLIALKTKAELSMQTVTK